MNIFKRFVVILSALVLGIVVTSPEQLPEAVAEVPESSTITRVGVVSDIVEADNITVKISGSNVLVTAAYLFPEYRPLLGDIVIVIKQDAQWFVIGTQSGPNNSAVLNSSFESGAGTGTPTSWTVVNDSTAAGTPTTNHAINSFALDGNGLVNVALTTTGAGASVTRLISTQVKASEGERWTAAAFSWAFVTSTSGLSIGAEVRIRFIDGGGGTLLDTQMSSISANSNQPNWQYNRTTFDPFVSAPANTEFVRLELLTRFTASSATPTSGNVFWDRAILRGPV